MVAAAAAAISGLMFVTWFTTAFVLDGTGRWRSWSAQHGRIQIPGTLNQISMSLPGGRHSHGGGTITSFAFTLTGATSLAEILARRRAGGRSAFMSNGGFSTQCSGSLAPNTTSNRQITLYFLAAALKARILGFYVDELRLDRSYTEAQTARLAAESCARRRRYFRHGPTGSSVRSSGPADRGCAAC